MSTFTRKRLADVMEREAKKQLKWSPGSEADKYKKKFWPVFGKGKWSWCAATVTWACEEAGLVMPVEAPSKFGMTFALVEAWQQWAMEEGFYHDNSAKFKAERGDISVFDWDQSDIDDKDNDWENHIGVVLGTTKTGYLTGEGNTGNQTNTKDRSPKTIQGFIRIPDGYTFTDAVDDAPAVPKPTKPVVLGDKGPAVKVLQAALIQFSRKFNPGPVDGVFGQRTKEAVTNFQIYNKMMPITGTADEATLELL